MILLQEVKGVIDKNGKYRKQGEFLCEFCNNKVIRYYYSGLKQKSCGCAKNQLISESNGKGEEHHSFLDGRTGTRLYNIYRRMKRRCNNIYNPNYGGRGITICPEWANDYVVFRDWALSNGYADNLEIDRINNNGNYEPNNCRWITHKENCNNRDLEHYKYKKSTILKDSEVKEIRVLWDTGNYYQKELGGKFQVKQSTISCIVNYKKWKNI